MVASEFPAYVWRSRLLIDSTDVADSPYLVRRVVSISPAGPAPTTTTSYFLVSPGRTSWGVGKRRGTGSARVNETFS